MKVKRKPFGFLFLEKLLTEPFCRGKITKIHSEGESSMNKTKRSITYLSRHRGKSFTLFLLLFILGIMVSGAVSLQQAVQNTESNLHRALPPIASISINMQQSIEFDREFLESGGTEEELRQWHIDNPQVVTDTMLRELASFPGVVSYDFSLSLFLNSPEVVGGNPITESVSQFTTRGVTVSEFFALISGAIEIIQGRTFLEEELTPEFTGSHPILISEQIASSNNLTIGSTFPLVNFVANHENFDFEERFTEEHAILWDEHIFEVVGIFEALGNEDMAIFSTTHLPHMELSNQFFIPAHIGYYFWHSQLENLLQHLFDIGWWSEQDVEMTQEQSNPWGNRSFHVGKSRTTPRV